MNRLCEMVDHVISQTAFVKEGVVILHEAMNSIHFKKHIDLMFKVDFGKAYDKIKWTFVYQMLKMKGSPNKWCGWAMMTMRGHVGIKVSDKIGPYFRCPFPSFFLLSC